MSWENKQISLALNNNLNMKNIKTVFLYAILMALCTETFSQVGLTSYSIFGIGINTNPNQRISGEFKAFANRDIEDVLVEIDAFYNFKPRDYHRFSIGIGLNIGPFRGFDHVNAITFPALIEIYPLQEFKKISLLFELSPEFVIEDALFLRNLWGIRYTFGE